MPGGLPIEEMLLNLRIQGVTQATGQLSDLARAFHAATPDDRALAGWHTFSSILEATGAGAVALGGKFLQLAASFQTAQVAMSVFSGSMQVAKKHLAELMQLSISTPFTFREWTYASRQMQAFGMTLQDTNRYLVTAGNVAASAGADLMYVAQAMAQIRGGAVGMGVSTLQAYGVPSAQIRQQLLKQGWQGGVYEAPAGMVLKAIDDWTKQTGRSSMMAKQMDTFAGQLTVLSDSFTKLGMAAGRALVQDVTPFIHGLATMTNTFAEAQEKGGGLLGKLLLFGGASTIVFALTLRYQLFSAQLTTAAVLEAQLTAARTRQTVATGAETAAVERNAAALRVEGDAAQLNLARQERAGAIRRQMWGTAGYALVGTGLMFGGAALGGWVGGALGGTGGAIAEKEGALETLRREKPTTDNTKAIEKLTNEIKELKDKQGAYQAGGQMLGTMGGMAAMSLLPMLARSAVGGPLLAVGLGALAGVGVAEFIRERGQAAVAKSLKGTPAEEKELQDTWLHALKEMERVGALDLTKPIAEQPAGKMMRRDEMQRIAQEVREGKITGVPGWMAGYAGKATADKMMDQLEAARQEIVKGRENMNWTPERMIEEMQTLQALGGMGLTPSQLPAVGRSAAVLGIIGRTAGNPLQMKYEAAVGELDALYVQEEDLRKELQKSQDLVDKGLEPLNDINSTREKEATNQQAIAEQTRKVLDAYAQLAMYGPGGLVQQEYGVAAGRAKLGPLYAKPSTPGLFGEFGAYAQRAGGMEELNRQEAQRLQNLSTYYYGLAQIETDVAKKRQLEIDAQRYSLQAQQLQYDSLRATFHLGLDYLDTLEAQGRSMDEQRAAAKDLYDYAEKMEAAGYGQAATELKAQVYERMRQQYLFTTYTYEPGIARTMMERQLLAGVGNTGAAAPGGMIFGAAPTVATAQMRFQQAQFEVTRAAEFLADAQSRLGKGTEAELQAQEKFNQALQTLVTTSTELYQIQTEMLRAGGELTQAHGELAKATFALAGVQALGYGGWRGEYAQKMLDIAGEREYLLAQQESLTQQRAAAEREVEFARLRAGAAGVAPEESPEYVRKVAALLGVDTQLRQAQAGLAAQPRERYLAELARGTQAVTEMQAYVEMVKARFGSLGMGPVFARTPEMLNTLAAAATESRKLAQAEWEHGRPLEAYKMMSQAYGFEKELRLLRTPYAQFATQVLGGPRGAAEWLRPFLMGIDTRTMMTDPNLRKIILEIRMPGGPDDYAPEVSILTDLFEHRVQRVTVPRR